MSGPDDVTAAGLLLVAGPLLGMLGFYDRALYRVWTAPREEHLALVAAHRRGWTMVNVGFTVATLLTTSGLILLAASSAVGDTWRALLVAGAVGYAIAGVLWCAVLAIRDRTTPTLASLVATGTPTEPVETLLGAVIGGLFASFSMVTSVALAGIGLALLLGGGVAAPVALLVALVGAFTAVWFVVAGDIIPAVLYLPTIALGIALIVGWT
jgi:hypothetical protein